MSSFDINAPVNFFVSSISPTTLQPGKTYFIYISGINLSKITKAYSDSIMVDSIKIVPDAHNDSWMNIEVTLRDNLDGWFFIILDDEDSSWNPIGPFIVKKESNGS